MKDINFTLEPFSEFAYALVEIDSVRFRFRIGWLEYIKSAFSKRDLASEAYLLAKNCLHDNLTNKNNLIDIELS